MTAIASQAFAILWREHTGYYIITHDGYFERDMCADSDEDAIQKTGWHIPTYECEATA
jgi:hypothetical protein